MSPMLPLPPGGPLHLFLLAAIAAVVGGLAAVERKGAFQLMLSRPLVLGPILGWALGDARGGLAVGVPLELLFSGTAFYADARGGLRAAMIPSSAECSHALPVEVWREAIELHFPGSAWLRLRGETFERLLAYKGRHALISFEQALERLLVAAGEGRP